MTKKYKTKTGGAKGFWAILTKIWTPSQRTTSITLDELDSKYFLKISDCPLTAWERRFKEGYSSIRRPDFKEDESLNEETDYDAWNLLFIDWQENVKQDPSFEEYMMNLKSLNDYYDMYLRSQQNRGAHVVRNRAILNTIRRLEGMVERYEKNLGKGQTINQTLVILSKVQGYHIKKQELTVQEYFDIIEINNEQNKAQKRWLKGTRKTI